eukprot:79620-Amphidinium_carterae.1
MLAREKFFEIPPVLAERLADIEKSLAAEIRKRGDMEAFFAQQVDAAVRLTCTRATVGIEDRLQTLHRQHVMEVRDRLTPLEVDMAALRSQLQVTSRTPAIPILAPRAEPDPHADWLAGNRRLAALEDRTSNLERTSRVSSVSLQHVSAEVEQHVRAIQ